MPRADEHEGDLNDSAIKRQGDRTKKRANEVLRGDLFALTENQTFLRWFGKYAYPTLVQNFPVNSGSELAKFMGRRELILQVVDEMDATSVGFLRRVLEARDQYELDLLAHAQQEEK